MIDSTSPFDRTSRADPSPDDVSYRLRSQAGIQADRVSMDQAAQLSSALSDQSEIRPEVVARGQELAADPSYPGPEILSRISALIVNSADPSEEAD